MVLDEIAIVLWPLIALYVCLTGVLPVVLHVKSRGHGMAAHVSTGLALIPLLVWAGTTVVFALDPVWAPLAVVPFAIGLLRLWGGWSVRGILRWEQA